MRFEDILELKVTIASKTPAELASLPAAVSVVTNEDIRRSGVTTIPDALRLVPGLHVGKINANTWAISAR
jgi:iron complex outermembrane recepter protein